MHSFSRPLAAILIGIILLAALLLGSCDALVTPPPDATGFPPSWTSTSTPTACEAPAGNLPSRGLVGIRGAITCDDYDLAASMPVFFDSAGATQNQIITFTVPVTGWVSSISSTIVVDGDWGWTYARIIDPDATSVKFYEPAGCGTADESCGIDDHNCEDANVTIVSGATPAVCPGCNDTEPCTGTFGPYSTDFVTGQSANGDWYARLYAIGGNNPLTYTSVIFTICVDDEEPTPTPTNTPTPTPTNTPTPTPTPTNTPLPEAYIIEVSASMDVTPTVASTHINWNLRSGSGVNDEFVEVYCPSQISLAGYQLSGSGDHLYVYAADNLCTKLQVIWCDEFPDCGDNGFPASGTFTLTNASGDTVDVRTYPTMAVSGNSWAADVYTAPLGSWSEHFPSPGTFLTPTPTP